MAIHAQHLSTNDEEKNLQQKTIKNVRIFEHLFETCDHQIFQ